MLLPGVVVSGLSSPRPPIPLHSQSTLVFPFSLPLPLARSVCGYNTPASWLHLCPPSLPSPLSATGSKKCKIVDDVSRVKLDPLLHERALAWAAGMPCADLSVPWVFSWGSVWGNDSRGPDSDPV